MNKRILNIMTVFLALVLVFSCVMIFGEVSKSEDEKQNFEKLSAEISAEIPESEGEDSEEEETFSKRNLAPLFEENPDCIGWVEIPGTAVNYPVMHTPEEPQKYLRLDFYGEYAMSGVPFLEGTRDLSDGHIIIYGHNMKNGTMFSDLMKYTEKTFFDEHRIIEFETAEGLMLFEIFAVAVLRSTDGWYYFNNPENPDAFAEFHDYIRERSLYETGTEPAFGGKILTLSTCYEDSDDIRLIVAGSEITG